MIEIQVKKSKKRRRKNTLAESVETQNCNRKLKGPNRNSKKDMDCDNLYMNIVYEIIDQ